MNYSILISSLIVDLKGMSKVSRIRDDFDTALNSLYQLTRGEGFDLGENPQPTLLLAALAEAYEFDVYGSQSALTARRLGDNTLLEWDGDEWHNFDE